MRSENPGRDLIREVEMGEGEGKLGMSKRIDYEFVVVMGHN